ncbi:TolC family outer membrane protein [Serratia rhizosphaerae]|uniref:TolC family outer membrane protein n=1 Tax=Serratia rhizosphaerae TaxID=2597702 RepID=UPI002DB8ECE4|nr:TolC family outer membrane protein [Serratia rhizosphaerae]MEB6334356.1 TolC family outer membrane protein [Serratia rhizosphaerae]
MINMGYDMYLIKGLFTLKPLLLASVLFPCVVNATTLLEAIRNAGAVNPELQAAMYRQLAGNEKSSQGLAGLLPTIQLSGGYNQQDQPKATYAAKVTRHNYAISLNQPLFDLSKYADYLRGKAIANSADIELLRAQETLAYDVADAYAAVLYQNEVYQAARAATQVYENELQQTTLAVSLGNATRVDADEAQANRDLFRAKEIEAHNNLSAVATKYRRLTGLEHNAIAPISAACLLQGVPSANEKEPDLYQRALAHNSQIRSARAQWEIAKTGVYQAHSAHMPTVNFQASYGSNWSRAEDSNQLDEMFGSTSKTTNTNLGVSVSVPIFSGGQQMSQSREAIYTREQARYSLIDAQQKVKEELHNALLNVTNSRSLVTSTQQMIRSEQSKIRSTATGKKLGLRTKMDELNAYQSYYEAVKNNAEARYKLLMAKVAQAQSTGDLGHNAIAQISCSQ